jgi:hypothetical protein
MVEFIIGGFDLSAYTEPKKLIVKRKNIFEDISLSDSAGVPIPKVIGSFYEIEGNVTAVPEETAAALIAAAALPSVSVTFPSHGNGGVSRTLDFTRPELTVTAVSERTDGDYFDIKLTLRSENIYSDDCL